jgi:hypothetical protein
MISARIRVSIMRKQLSIGLLLLFAGQVVAQVPAPVITNFNVSGAQKNIRFAPYPAAEAYTLLSASHAGGVFTVDTNFFIAAYTNIVVQGTNSVTNVAYEWRATNNAGSSRLYRLQVNPLSASNVLGAIALSRLTYGPTPDALQSMAVSGPDAFIAQQLAPWTITENAEAADTNIAVLAAKLAAFDEPVTTNHARLPEFRACGGGQPAVARSPAPVLGKPLCHRIFQELQFRHFERFFHGPALSAGRANGICRKPAVAGRPAESAMHLLRPAENQRGESGHDHLPRYGGKPGRWLPGAQ